MFIFRLGLLGNTAAAQTSFPAPKPVKESKRNEDRTAKRFDSSLGSDTGTSTRESECSEEHSPGSLLSPTQTTLYDSLAAELRAKLNGNGPPLLLPPRDYDTVHRAKGNLAATELRRCRNSMIVGAPGSKYGVSSRGSSGIGSDLAPSPERNEGHSSSGMLIGFILKYTLTHTRYGNKIMKFVWNIATLRNMSHLNFNSSVVDIK